MKKTRVESLIEELRNMSDTNNLSVFDDHSGWVYYFSVSGFIDSNYFSLFFFKLKKEDEHETQICGTTDKECKPIVKKLLKKHNL